MRIDDFDYILPADLIAQFPTEKRGQSKLLVVNPLLKKTHNTQFVNFFSLINPDDLIVFNDTKVLKARLFGKKETGGKIEILIERIIDEKNALAMIRSSKKISQKNIIQLSDGHNIGINGREDSLYKIQLNKGSFYEVLENLGHIPLPPYIKRADLADKEDPADYQTLFAEKPGAVAAPTASLHFTAELMRKLQDRGVDHVFLTLHVGAGTFLPVKVNDTNDHKMHAEWGEISNQAAEKINSTKKAGGRIIAVGSTALRLLESAADEDGTLQPFCGDTDIFITPGYQFKIPDMMLTNFHLPRSTLVMLVSAFVGMKHMKQAYKYAKLNGYRFYSYGDCCLLDCQNKL